MFVDLNCRIVPYLTMHYDRPNPPLTDLTQLARRFEHFATTEVEETSPLYHRLALAVASDPDLLALASTVRSGQPPANMLFGAVHYLLITQPSLELARYFPDLTADPLANTNAAPLFRTFCLEHRAAIVDLLRTRLVQTNELRRCAYLLPALSYTAMVAQLPLALVELGASAELNLLFDHYTVHYDLGVVRLRAGAAHSTVEIDVHCLLDPSVELPVAMPVVSHRIGVDISPVNLADDDSARWLHALIWPEHADRVQRFEQARRIWLQAPPTLVQADAADFLPSALGDLPEDVAPVVFHTHVLNQFTPAAAAELEARFYALSHARTIYRIGNDLGGGTPKQYVLRLRIYRDGAMQETILGHTDGHARQIAWLAAPSR
jgi:hypothetical protein